MPALNIDEPGLARLVDTFYARVRADAELGPIFNDAIHDWPEHLEKLSAFWSSVMLTSGRYKGQPVPAHVKHRGRITPALFARWLALWAETTDELMAPDAAAALQAKAARIAESLKLAMFFRLDGQPTPKPSPRPTRATAAATDHA
ncbi:group III truncated hemoglobin [Aurantiacibacter suaedae]|uniref:group III truncated hemoglobin n=1 Tax=Aurantiacibacter suaedae TaxID=2545755 RepID=UPI0010FA316E|nr:group III truncated hemoglobin [Aurantiacibacter suaedae]